MKYHTNAKLTQVGRLALCQAVETGEAVTKACCRVGISRSCFYVWWHRYLDDPTHLEDRSSAPLSKARGLDPEEVAMVLTLSAGLHKTVPEISEILNLHTRSVYRCLSEYQELVKEPKPPVTRYEYQTPGGLIHMDTHPRA